MDFLLECIGFPPGHDTDELVERAGRDGEAVPWRGDPASHRRLVLGEGLELRVDRDPGQDFWTLLPHYRVTHRLRVRVDSFQRVPDSPFDGLLTGWACPPTRAVPDPPSGPLALGAYRLSTWLTDARRVPRKLPPRHVLAVSVAGFSLDVTYVGPNAGLADPLVLERPHGAWVAPLGAPDSPAGCSEVSVRVTAIQRLRNRVTGEQVELVVADAPERPILLFLSPWQLNSDGLPRPRPGWRVEGTFLFTGRVAGGLVGPRRRAPRTFG